MKSTRSYARSRQDLTGEVSGSLVVEREATAEEILLSHPKVKTPRFRYWLCRCVCGNAVVMSASRVGGKQVSCGCSRASGRVRSKVPQDVTANARRRVYQQYQDSAKERGHVFSLTILEFERIVSQDCRYCGGEPSNVRAPRKRNRNAALLAPFRFNGIDRADNSLGYIVSNCVPCCKDCNYAKRVMSTGEFKEWVGRVHANCFDDGLLYNG